MPELRTHKGYWVPGGWKAWVPEFFADEDYVVALRQALRGWPEGEAEARIQQLGEVEYLSRLRDFIKRMGDQYADRWREKVDKQGNLIGFDPEALQTRYILGSKSAGQKPKTNIINALQKMAMTE